MGETSTKGKFLGRHLRPYTSLISRVVLGGVFIYAGIAKMPHIGTLIDEIEKYQILPSGLALAYGSALPFVEVFLGDLLVLGAAIRVSASVSGLLVLSFAIAKTTALVRGLDINVCPCFGPFLPLLTIHSLAIDLVLLALAIQLILYRSELLSFDALFSVKKHHNQER